MLNIYILHNCHLHNVVLTLQEGYKLPYCPISLIKKPGRTMMAKHFSFQQLKVVVDVILHILLHHNDRFLANFSGHFLQNLCKI